MVLDELNVRIEQKLYSKNVSGNIMIIDPYGSIISDNNFKINGISNFVEKIDVRHLNSGTYIVTIKINNWIKSFKFIK